MPLIDFPFISNKPGLEGRYPVNLYLTPESERGTPSLAKRPGWGAPKVTPAFGSVRGFTVIGKDLYAVIANKLYRITDSWASTEIGVVSKSAVGNLWIENNGTLIACQSGTDMYVYSLSTGNITQGSGFGFKTLTYQDRYFISAAEGSESFYITLDPSGAWDILDEGAAYGRSDNIKAVKSDQRILHVFGENVEHGSKEAYWNQGSSDFPYKRIQGSFTEVGLGASKSLVSLDNSIFFLDNNKRVLRTTGAGGYQVVSTPQITKKIAGYTRDDAVGMGIYWDDNNAFYVLTFPTSDVTWVYDVQTQSWVQWTSKRGNTYNHRWIPTAYTKFDGQHVVGDSQGNIYVLDSSAYDDNGDLIRWSRTAPPVIQQGREIFFNELIFDMATGVGLAGATKPPFCWLDYSDDDGKTWSKERFGSVGKIGEYDLRVRFQALGSARKRSPRLSGSEAVKTEIHGAFLDADIGLS
tara:strand:- start:500 stop:1897 length:1398 start_codon:yes stop_codon:yes gene_type:complete